MYICIDDNITTRIKSNTNEEETTLTTRLLKYHTKPRLKIQTFCLPLSHFHTNTNSHLKGTRRVSDVDLVDENFIFTHTYRYTGIKFYLN
jgi:hypothetical protein